MEIIALVNQKGGAAKTTTAMNLAATLGQQGRRVLLVDMDPQATLTKGLGIMERGNVFEATVPVTIRMPGVEAIPGGPGLVRWEMDLTVREDFGVLRPILAGVRGFDYVVLDFPPNLYGGTTNAIVAADRLLIPIPLSLHVLQSLSDTMQLLRSLRALGHPTPNRVTGVITIYRKVSVEAELARLADRLFGGGLLETRIRMSNLYTKAELRQTPAVLFSKPGSAPVVDHLRLVQELGLA